MRSFKTMFNTIFKDITERASLKETEYQGLMTNLGYSANMSVGTLIKEPRYYGFGDLYYGYGTDNYYGYWEIVKEF